MSDEPADGSGKERTDDAHVDEACESDPDPLASDWVPGETDRDEPELARVGRLLVAYQIDREVADLREIASRIVNRALEGEDLREQDIEGLENAMNNLEHALTDYAKPIVNDDWTTPSERGHAGDSQATGGEDALTDTSSPPPAGTDE